MIQSVIVTEEAYKQMFRYVIEYANPNRPYRQWKEVIGWLIGSVENETATITKAIPMTSGSSIFVQMTDYTIIPQIAEEAERENAVIVGWFHSHPSFGFFLSGVDVRTQRYQQSLFENAIALVCDPTKISSIECGMHGFQVFMEERMGREYRELEVVINTNEFYPDLLRDLLLEIGVERSYSEIISYEELADLYALEGISPPHLAALISKQLLPSEQAGKPLLEAQYYVTHEVNAKEEFYVEIRIANIGEGVAWNVDFVFDTGPDFKLSSMYPHRILDQLLYDSAVIETFRLKSTRKGELFLPRTVINYKTADQKRFYIVVSSVKIIAK
ncbi:MAG: Mov34/MPN/PAD-1 family protein [Candidatus Thorarchaeota archaeon]